MDQLVVMVAMVNAVVMGSMAFPALAVPIKVSMPNWLQGQPVVLVQAVVPQVAAVAAVVVAVAVVAAAVVVDH